MTTIKPFVKWAGGKRWLTTAAQLEIPNFKGRYIEPFIGGGAMFFHLRPANAIIADLNADLINAYIQIRDNHEAISDHLKIYQKRHNKDFYYIERARIYECPIKKAAQFLYLNRTCWNGLYRVNLKGQFNVPIGTKDKIYDAQENFIIISEALKGTKITCTDFEKTINMSKKGDFIFVDPPYTTMHNNNGFIKYNQNIFSWDDQIRLKNALSRAKKRGIKAIVTNADHYSIIELYSDIGKYFRIERPSVISGKSTGRHTTSEALIYI